MTRMPPGPLRLRRLELGLTQRDLAGLAGVSHWQIMRLEARTCSPMLSTALALAGALRADLADVFPETSNGAAGNGAVAKTAGVGGRHGEA
jgi:DNA-binding XRE family transcriptional regulator